MTHLEPAVHRTILVVDVEGFGNRRRTNPHQVAVREGLYHALRGAFGKVNIPWTDCHREDRGDGVLVLAPAEVAKSPFVESLPRELAAAVREHNSTHGTEERIRLRMALHAGEIHHDDHGVAGAAINLAFRLLDAAALKAALADSPGVLALIVSSWFYDEVVRHSAAGNPAAYRRVRVIVKETSADAWIALPDQPDPPPLATASERSTQVPRQLPAHTSHFVGRTDELKQLSTLLDTATHDTSTVVITAINGTAGIGKTALAVHWAHQAADRFPDGQLYVNLRGFDPTNTPMPPADAIRGFLDAFEISPERIPVHLDAQAALYRSLLTERRMLVVLDNARDTEQVRPLLPGSRTCLVVVTSRNRLAGLVAHEGARPVTLNVLSPEEGAALFARYLGEDRVAAEQDAITELIERCARLPLALAIVAARAATNPRFPLRALAEELADERDRLDALDTGDLGTDVRAVFSWSYRTLTPQAARLFRLLGVHPGPEIDLYAAASLTGIPTSRARALLIELTRARLLDENTPGRYRFHDLLRAYATEQAAQEESEQERRAALHRVLDSYLHTGLAADRCLHPHREPITLDAPQSGVTSRRISDYEQAVDWFSTEHATLLAATDHAARTGLNTHAWQLPWTLATFLNRRGHWHDFAATHQTALAAAGRLDDRTAQARTHRDLSRAYRKLGRYADALGHLQRALTLFRDLGDRTGQAATHHALSMVCERQGHYTEALTHAQQALNLSRATGNHGREARALNSLGWYHARLGHYTEALTHAEHALNLFRELGDRHGEAATLDSLGFAYHHLGRHTEALTHYQQSLDLWRKLGDPYWETDTLTHLGDTHHATGNHSDARRAWQQALTTLDQLGHPDAEQVRAKLAELDRTGL